MSKIKKDAAKASNPNKESKDAIHMIQMEKVFQAFFEEPMTMKEADRATGIMRESICRYVGTLRKQNRIAVIKKRYCSVTKHLAAELTTDPYLMPIKLQLNLF